VASDLGHGHGHGGPAQERLRLRKAYYYRGPPRPVQDFPGYRVVAADVPYCAACAARHRQLLPEVSFLRRYGTFLLNPAHLATIGFVVRMQKTWAVVAIVFLVALVAGRALLWYVTGR
jgi:hypothetical protein